MVISAWKYRNGFDWRWSRKNGSCGSIFISLSDRYQINARTDLAVRYNDISPLENHHCAVAFKILSNPDCNIFANAEPEDFKQIRQVGLFVGYVLFRGVFFAPPSTKWISRYHTIDIYEGVSNNSWHHPEVKEPHTSFWYLIHKTSLKDHYAKFYTFLRLFIDCPHTKIVTWVHDTEIHNGKYISRNGLHTIIHPNIWAPPEMYFGYIFIEVRPTKLISTQFVWSRKTILIIIYSYIVRVFFFIN